MLLKALRAAACDLNHSPEVSAETPTTDQPQPPTSTSLADALLTIAEAFLAEKVAAADDPEVYQVILHVGTDAITPAGPAADAKEVSAETSGPFPQPPQPQRPQPPGHPANPARCHVEDGPAISVTAAQMIACSSTLSWMLHDSVGQLLDLGRRRRRPNAALRRAARDRDKCRCRFPGCESRRVDLHHIQYWSNGGRTTLTNIISLYKYHHLLVHDRGYLIAAARDGTFAFYRPEGTPIPSSPALPHVDGAIDGCHEADITPDTIIPPWYGERLDLDHAIYICLADARNQAAQRDGCIPPIPHYQQDDHDQSEPFQPRVWPTNTLDWMAKVARERVDA